MIEAYLSYVIGVRRYSARTAEVYRAVLEEYAGFSGEVFTPTAIRNYEVWLMDDRGLDARTVNLHLSVLSGYCRYLVRNGELGSNPVRLVARPKMGRRLPLFYRQDAIDGYLSSTQYAVEGDDLGMRSRYEQRLRRLIVSMLYGTGIRRSELISLTRSSLDEARRVLRVRGKGDKMREIPLVDSLYEEILLYLQSVDTMVEGVHMPDDPLLVTAAGRKLYPVLVDRAVKTELGGSGDITGRKSPHVLRHTLATELLDDGADLNSIKELLGHSSLAATQVYTHNTIEKLRSVYNNAHPRAKNGGNYGNKD